MKQINLKHHFYDKFGDIILTQPDDVVWSTLGNSDIGPILHKDCLHYMTIVPKEYKDQINCKYGLSMEEFGDYVIFGLEDMSMDNELPITDASTWDSLNLSKYVIRRHDLDGNIMNYRRILHITSINRVEFVEVSLRDYFSISTMLRLNHDIRDLSLLIEEPMRGLQSRITVMEGEKAELEWNSAIHQTIKLFTYDESKVDKEYKFDEMIKYYEEKLNQLTKSI